SEYASVNPNSIQTGGVATYAYAGDLNGNGKADQNELLNANYTRPAAGVAPTPKSVFTPRSNRIDPNLKDPKNDEIMFAFQRELAANWSLSVDWIQRWFSDMTTDQNCYGLPCDQVLTTAYTSTPTRNVVDSGPDNIRGTADDRNLSFYDVKP